MNKLLMVALLAVSSLSLQLSACKSGCKSGCESAPKCTYTKTYNCPAKKVCETNCQYVCPEGTEPQGDLNGQEEGGKY